MSSVWNVVWSVIDGKGEYGTISLYFEPDATYQQVHDASESTTQLLKSFIDGAILSCTLTRKMIFEFASFETKLDALPNSDIENGGLLSFRLLNEPRVNYQLRLPTLTENVMLSSGEIDVSLSPDLSTLMSWMVIGEFPTSEGDISAVDVRGTQIVDLNGGREYFRPRKGRRK